MRTIIAGSRKCDNMKEVEFAIKTCNFIITTVISGNAKGVDRLGEIWAIKNKIPLKRFPADWNKYHKSAGYIRNEEMANNADALIAVWDGYSKGTEHMINIAKQKNLKIYVHYIGSKENNILCV